MHRLWCICYFETMFVLVEHLNTVFLKLPTFRLLIDLVVIGLEIPHVLNFPFFDDANINI